MALTRHCERSMAIHRQIKRIPGLPHCSRYDAGKGCAHGGASRAVIAHPSSSVKVDKALLGVNRHQLDPHFVADVQAFDTAHHAAFEHRAADAHESPLRWRTGHDGVKNLADTALQQPRARGFEYLSLNLAGVVFL